MCRAGLTYYQNDAWGDLRHGIFTRRGGVSRAPWASLNLGASKGDEPAAVAENHKRVYRAIGVDGARAASCWLVHSVDTLVIRGEARQEGNLRKADALITDQQDTPLVMRYADCVPLLYFDRARRVIGLGHAGWRGTVKGMASKVISMMRKTFGCRAADIEVVIGPAISRRNYRVGAEVIRQAEAYFGADAGLVWRDSADGSAYFDLWRANELDLVRCGVKSIEILELCTYENTRDFYSHRAENGVTGRFGVVMSL